VKPKKLIALLTTSDNPAADSLLLEALRMGNEAEQAQVLDVLLRRSKQIGLMGVLAAHATLPPRLRQKVTEQAAAFYSVLSDAGRSSNRAARIAAIRMIAAARLGKLSYVLAENLRDPDDELSSEACQALLDLARWVNTQSRLMHRYAALDDLTLVGNSGRANDSTIMAAPTANRDLQAAYDQVMKQRPEIENAVARALDYVKTKHAQDLLRAALLLCDHPQSRTLAILKATRHGGQMSMVRKLQQSPTAENVEAFLLGGSHGHLRPNFAIAYAQIDDPAVLSVLLRHTHWLADHQLRLCLETTDRGPWLDLAQLPLELQNRLPEECACAGAWITASGLHAAQQDERLLTLLDHIRGDTSLRLQLLRQVAARRDTGPGLLLRKMIDDPDERLARIAARELIRRRPADYETVLLQQINKAAPTVRRVIGRAMAQAGFDRFWNRFEQMDKPVRQQAGRAMLKLLPDAPTRLGRLLSHGTAEHRVRALQIVQELNLAEQFRDTLKTMCSHTNARVRSKAVGAMIALSQEATNPILSRVLSDADPRVRANAVEVLEATRSKTFVPMLTERARSSHNRERANAIKALHRMKVETATQHLQLMLRDPRAEHRISAIWTLRHTGIWALIGEVGKLASSDENPRVRRYATTMLRNILDTARREAPLKKVA
jgi:hypothetical protein